MKPAFKITVAGTNITQLVADRLISLTVHDEAGVKSDRVELVIDDRDQRLELPPTKARMTVAIGYANSLVNKGEFVVEEVEVEGPERKLIIRANAVGASLGSGAGREASYHDTTLGDVVKKVAARHGWQPAISGDLASIAIPHVDQRENDLQFLVRLAAQNGAVAKVAHGKLVVAPHAQGKATSGRALPTINVQCTDTTEWICSVTERGNYKRVRAKYHDTFKAKRGEALAGDDDENDENTHTLPHTYGSEEEAQRAATSKHGALQRALNRFSIRSMPGNAAIEAECQINATGFRTGVDGLWVASTVMHVITDGGFHTSVECEDSDFEKAHRKQRVRKNTHK